MINNYGSTENWREMLIRTSIGALSVKNSPTNTTVRETVVKMNAVLSQVSPGYKVEPDIVEQVILHLEATHGVVHSLGYMLSSEDHIPWLANEMENIETYYWDRYRNYLLQAEQFPHKTVDVLDQESDRVLDRLENPKREGLWSRRGMVIGHVQSGKTTNFSALICKAADAGYKVIIILSGIHNMLRNQTQHRMDENFVGRESRNTTSNQHRQVIGVGKFANDRYPFTFTNSLKDFDKGLADTMGGYIRDINEPALFVIKKNTSSLNKIYEWLKSNNTNTNSPKINLPVLIIDDEADNASINTKQSKGEITKINGQIRSLLELFERNAYVGYTATPFANIFIDPETDSEVYGEDLFPRDFIWSLAPSSQYIGPEKMFLEDNCLQVREIYDNEDDIPVKHNKYLEINALPTSLIRSLKTFVLTRAIRLARRHQHFHSTMLVNVSRFPSVHDILRFQIHNELQVLQARVRNKSALSPKDALKDQIMKDFHEIWSEEFNDSEFEWTDIQKLLHRACAPIEVLEVNSNSTTPLEYADYKNGRSLIVVGGFSLSRGLTLEGLTVSYVIRNSSQQDTLMQMGRWFGYRPDYADLCRLWLTEEAIENFSKTAETIQELREQLREMASSNATPLEFGLRVRNHPGRLMITAKNKIGYGREVTVNAQLDLQLVETFALQAKKETLNNNLYQLELLSKNLTKHGLNIKNAIWDDVSNNGYLLKNVPVGCITDFIRGFQNSPISVQTQAAGLNQYIDKRANYELSGWDILFTSLQQPYTPEGVYQGQGLTINCTRRTVGIESNKDIIYVGGSRHRRLGQPSHESAGLTAEQKKVAEESWFAANPEKPKKTATVPGTEYRKVPNRNPLLIIHIINLLMNEKIEKKQVVQHYLNIPILSWSISFPPTDTPSDTATYILNSTAVQLAMKFDDDEEEEDYDND